MAWLICWFKGHIWWRDMDDNIYINKRCARCGAWHKDSWAREIFR